MTYSYQWQRADDAAGTRAADIAGATTATYTPTVVDNQKYLRVRVTATDNGEGLPASTATTANSVRIQVTNVLPAITEGGSASVP